MGGVAANGAIVKALNEVLSARNGHPVQVIVPENYLYMEALGSALLSAGKRVDGSICCPERCWLPALLSNCPDLQDVALPGNGLYQRIARAGCAGYLGVDVGSTSTKAVIMDETGERILAKNYLMTAGRPVDAVKQVFANLVQRRRGTWSISRGGRDRLGPIPGRQPHRR